MSLCIVHDHFNQEHSCEMSNGLKILRIVQLCFLKNADIFLILTGYQLGDGMRPHPAVVGALKMICTVVPSWRVIPAPDKLDKVCKDPQFRKEVLVQKKTPSSVITLERKEQRRRRHGMCCSFMRFLSV
jgi:hypothetical protein